MQNRHTEDLPVMGHIAFSEDSNVVEQQTEVKKYTILKNSAYLLQTLTLVMGVIGIVLSSNWLMLVYMLLQISSFTLNFYKIRRDLKKNNESYLANSFKLILFAIFFGLVSYGLLFNFGYFSLSMKIIMAIGLLGSPTFLLLFGTIVYFLKFRNNTAENSQLLPDSSYKYEYTDHNDNNSSLNIDSSNQEVIATTSSSATENVYEKSRTMSMHIDKKLGVEKSQKNFFSKLWSFLNREKEPPQLPVLDLTNNSSGFRKENTKNTPNTDLPSDYYNKMQLGKTDSNANKDLTFFPHIQQHKTKKTSEDSTYNQTSLPLYNDNDNRNSQDNSYSQYVSFNSNTSNSSQ